MTIRVLHVITRMVDGGAQRNTLATAAGINGSGWTSGLVMGPSGGPEGTIEVECEAAGLRVARIPELVRELAPRSDAAALARLIRVFRDERPHIVHTHTSKAGILGRLAARACRVPLVVHTPHGHVFHGYGGEIRSRLFVYAERLCAPLADRLVALTDAEMKEHIDLRVGPPARWRTIHSGVDFSFVESGRGRREETRDALGIPAEAMVVGAVGRLVPIKGTDVLIDAFARLAPARAGAHLLLVGDGPLRDDLARQARYLGLDVIDHAFRTERRDSGSATVHMLGLRRDVPALLSAMDLFALASRNEGMGRVLVEAMAMELPCVASRVSGIPDVVDDGVTGILVPPDDPDRLANAIGSILDDPARAREMGRQGRRKVVPEFGVERMVEKIEALYRELLLAHGIAPPGALPAVDSGRASMST